MAMVRAEASASKRTVATLPISPSATGNTCISTVASWPGPIVPSVQTKAPCGPREAGGTLPNSLAPRGAWSRTSTSLAAPCPVLRTVTRNVAGLPT